MNENYKLFRNIRLIDGVSGKTDACDLLFRRSGTGSEILKIGKGLRPGISEGLTVLNAHGRLVCPSPTCAVLCRTRALLTEKACKADCPPLLQEGTEECCSNRYKDPCRREKALFRC